MVVFPFHEGSGVIKRYQIWEVASQLFPKARSVSGKEREKTNVEQHLTLDKKKVNILSKADIMLVVLPSSYYS